MVLNPTAAHIFHMSQYGEIFDNVRASWKIGTGNL